MVQVAHMQKYRCSQTYTRGDTGLHIAVRVGLTNLVRRLCSSNVNISAQTEEGMSPLHEAAQRGDNEMISLLLEAGATTNMLSRGRVRTQWVLLCCLDFCVFKAINAADVKSI
ncbi:hypothetical protein F4810DRAFT_663915 [Camillea tinctor]|nr:hypothetical protein F4810DRAFT_663915 [Camillea tinctor]